MDQYTKKISVQSKYLKLEANSPSIMESVHNLSLDCRPLDDHSIDCMVGKFAQPDVTLTTDIKSLKLNMENDDKNGFLLIDGKENLKLSTAEEFLNRLKIKEKDNIKVKVVSIFGNTGDGKSYTLNHTFFNGEEVFKTSSEQESCTMGVWAAFDQSSRVICLDTEGLLGATCNENQRTRLLLKILAVSDLVLYRTKSERLHRDMYTFLGSASRAFTHHFYNALQCVGLTGPVSMLGPAVIIFHETRHTRTLQSSLTESAEDFLRRQFNELKLEMDAFSSVKYVGIQTKSPPTVFTDLKTAVQTELNNTTVRSPRLPSVVFQTLKVLNDKFSGELANTAPLLFPDQYFTCPEVCMSCNRRCESSMGHLKEKSPHSSTSKCKYQYQYENCIYVCKKCHAQGIEQIVEPRVLPGSAAPWYGLAKYVWSGYTIDCPQCGEIYTSRQYWYGNKPPEQSRKIRTEIVHVWPDCQQLLADSSGGNNMARRVLESVTYITDSVASVGSEPTKKLTSILADKIAPSYWRPNHEIKHCYACGKLFTRHLKKHHCRCCGEGFCDSCSSREMSVPQHGWSSPVRVCDNCYNRGDVGEAETDDCARDDDNDNDDDKQITARKYGEVVVNAVATMLHYPTVVIKESARPDYWIPDSEIHQCVVCTRKFDFELKVHHCRDCGHGVCSKCSSNKKIVLKRGWETPVRVCDTCYNNTSSC